MIITQRRWWRMVDHHMSRPVTLHKADLTKPFIYDRAFGVFYCEGGYHQGAMALLLAFHNGSTDAIGIAEGMGLSYSEGAADYFIEHTPGTCFRSSVGRKIAAGRKGNLNATELRLLGCDIDYLFT